MDFSHIVSEDKIKRAIKDGEFENLREWESQRQR